MSLFSLCEFSCLDEILSLTYTHFFEKEQVFKQLALG